MKRRFRARRRGITLIELLVVATIMLTLTAVSVPTIKPMMESQLTSSAATSVSTYLNRARARAMATGRPCGVAFEYYGYTYNDELPDDAAISRGSASVVLRQVETPPYYSGLETGANATVLATDADGGSWDVWFNGKKTRRFFVNDSTANSASAWEIYVLGEKSPKIQFNSVGPFYPIYIDRDDDGNLISDANGYRFFIESLPGIDLPQRVASPFKVVRDPRATMTAPIGVPSGTVVDLAYSGTDSRSFGLNGDVTIMFAPSGEIDSIVDSSGQWSPTEPVYLLIGRWDRISALATGATYLEGGETYYLSGAEDGRWNYEDGTNFWVTINPRNGLVSTTAVMPPYNYNATDESVAVLDSREFARNSKRNVGAR